ncbi:glucan endo-1,3-beta-glucosidase 11-like [Ananas comosus]|uniref:Glucan endo-1,3-beta-glucosidase 11-like n=1 Tax=Ananas comosus TaxID=4615 RepID=A0A6P5FT73_ANACO|nr:glucan endo-1,3-beta-glucosidase 11-like [Ananas comosus]
MTNVHATLARLGLDGSVKVSSPIALTVLRSSYPPFAGTFPNDLAERVMRPMLDLLRHTGSYLMVNAYTFFAYSTDAALISLDYAANRPDTGLVSVMAGLVTAHQVFDLRPQ